MRPLAEAASRVIGQNCSRKHVALGRIISHWNDIVGDSFAAKAVPVRIDYRKRSGAGKTARGQQTPVAVLEIGASSADATVLHYQVDLILERIQHIFGERWIAAVKFVTIPANLGTIAPPKVKTHLTEHEKDILCHQVQQVTDPELQSCLFSLGQLIAMEAKT